MERSDNLELEIKRIAESFVKKTKGKEIFVISHFDADGISSAAIIIQTLKKLDRKFNLKIVKNLEEKLIKSLPKNRIILFIDLASGSLNHIKNAGLKEVFIIDHHEIVQEIPKEVEMLNPRLYGNQKISSSGLTYLFSKEINSENKKLAKLAIIGMVGDQMEKNIDKLNHEILENSEIQKKRGLLVYPATRPLNLALEYSSNPFIPGISGNPKQILNFLREIGLTPTKGKYKSLLELNEEEMKKMITTIMLLNPKLKTENVIGDIFLIKFYNQLEDVREICARINACSRYGESETAIQICMEIAGAKKRAQTIHSKYKQELIAGLTTIQNVERFEEKNFVIFNAKNKIKDTMIGTITSILANSSIYNEGTNIISLAYYEDKIKISARNVGDSGRNIREILQRVIFHTGGECGGHEFAAGGTISREKEQEFINLLRKSLEIETIKI